MHCTLCSGITLTTLSFKDDAREYLKCETCYLIFANPRFHLPIDEERNRYLKHNNSIENAGYVIFLSRVIQPCLKFITSEMVGLDYGCGPVPTLSRILAQYNIRCFDYDPLFALEHPLDTYDFIFATECFEHFFNPFADLSRIDSMLKPGGFMAIMTELWTSMEQFETWYYKNDPTHVSFFHKKTFTYLCEEFKYEVKYQDQSRVMILQKIS